MVGTEDTADDDRGCLVSWGLLIETFDLLWEKICFLIINKNYYQDTVNVEMYALH